MDTLQVFGTTLRSYRLAAGLSQEALARRAGLSARAIKFLEGGHRRPHPDTIRRLAAALELSPDAGVALTAAVQRGRRAGRVWPSHAEYPVPGSRPTTPVVGRDLELDWLDRQLMADGAPVLMIAGEPGIGKTRLLQEAATRGSRAGYRVLAGGCQRRGGDVAYAPVLEAFERHIEQLPMGQRLIDLEGCAWLARLLPELGEAGLVPPVGSMPPEQERRLIFKAAGTFLANVAGPSGLMLLLDDLQWAGSDAIDLLAALARAPQGTLRVVGAYRDTEREQAGPLATWLADLAHAGMVAHITLAPLARPDAAHLLDLLLSDTHSVGTRDLVLQRAGGVPFFLVSCAQALVTGSGDADRIDLLPWTVRQSVSQRVAALPREVQDMLDAAAVSGRLVQPALLSAVLSRPEEEILASLDAAIRARLLSASDGAAYQFAHDVIREVVEGALGAAGRAALHRRIAGALERQPGELPVVALAYHYERCGMLEQAALYLGQAGDRAFGEQAHTTAATYYQGVVERLDQLGRRQESAPVREKLGAALGAAARFGAALVALEQAADIYRRVGAVEALGHVGAHIGWVHLWRGTSAEGLRVLQPILDLVAASGTVMNLAAVHMARAGLLFAVGRYGEMLATAETAADLARAEGNTRVLASTELARGLGLRMLGHIRQARRTLEDSIPLAEADEEITTLCLLVHNVAHNSLMLGEFDRARICSQRALALAERSADPNQIAFMRSRRGVVAYYLGDWRAALGDTECALVMRDQVSQAWLSTYILIESARLSLAMGRLGEAAQRLDESRSISERLGDQQALRWIDALLAERDLREGRPDRVLLRIEPVARLQTDEPDIVALLPILAEAYLELGDASNAEDAAARAVARSRATEYRLNLVDALRMRGMIEAQQNRFPQAEDALEESLALARSMPYPYGEVRVLQAYGTLRAQQGHPDRAAEFQTEALRKLALFG